MKNYLLDKLEQFQKYVDSKGKKYTLSPTIRKEMIDFLKWNKPGLTDEEYSKLIDSYFTEKDFMWQGDLRVMHGTNTRTSTFDVIMALTSILLAVIVVIVVQYLFF